MNITDLINALRSSGIREDAYSVDSSPRDESLCLEVDGGTYRIYYSERGLRTGEAEYRSEDEACREFYRMLLEDPTSHR